MMLGMKYLRLRIATNCVDDFLGSCFGYNNAGVHPKASIDVLESGI